MFPFPPIPSWDALHPLVIHFPIALLLIAPLFVIAGAIMQPAKGRAYHLAGLALMFLGTAAVFLAVGTGEAAGEQAERIAGVKQVLEAHETLAERTRVVFSVLSVIFATVLFVPRWLKHAEGRLVTTTLPLAFLVLYSAGMLLLVNTAHNGGRLVHEFGVHARVAGAAPPGAMPTAMLPSASAADENDKD